MLLRCLPLLLALILLLQDVAASDGQPAAAAGSSSGPRFRVSAAVLPVRQAPVAAARFRLAPFPTAADGAAPSAPIFANGFE